MTKEIRIYVEGGGTTSDSKAAIRLGFGEFLKELRESAQAKRIRWQIIACGGRDAALDAFQSALKLHPDAFNVLLVDAEGPVDQPPQLHLAAQGLKLPNVGAEHFHLMVQTVEAWLIADLEALKVYYGQGFLGNSLPNTSTVETIPKDDLVPKLEHATKGTQKGRYHKIKHCADLLMRIKPATVRSKAKHCERLFQELKARL